MGSGAIYRLGAYKDIQGCMGFKLTCPRRTWKPQFPNLFQKHECLKEPLFLSSMSFWEDCIGRSVQDRFLKIVPFTHAWDLG